MDSRLRRNDAIDMGVVIDITLDPHQSARRAMNKRKLPIGIQTFREIREEGCYYVDKTPYLRRLVDEGKHYFLSRPRRFGKSLLLDTLKELFEANEPLFEGLDVHGHWDWSVRHPVVRLDFGSGDFKGSGYLHKEVMAQLAVIEDDAAVAGRFDTAPARLRHLLKALHRRTGQRVVVLVDDYDKPILDALDQPAAARANRDYLLGLYSTIKSSDAYVQFTLLAGVSKFPTAGLFSGLNNLINLTLDPRHSAICGYTDADLDTVFSPELPGLDREAIREWYGGYNWRGEGRVYNPFDILLFFRHRAFDAWWFETGTPSFLIDTLLRRGVGTATLDGMLGTRALLSGFDVDEMTTEALLFQTGCLTIRNEEDMGGLPLYRLGYPNREVRQSLNRSLLRAMTPDDSRHLAHDVRLRQLLAVNDFDGLETLIRMFFSGTPCEWHTRNDIARFEGYYASVFYSHFAAVGLDVTVEDSSSHGRVDMTVRFNGHVYLFEFKALELAPVGAAMEQLKERRCAEKYRHLGEPIHLIGVEFSREMRSVAGFEVARA